MKYTIKKIIRLVKKITLWFFILSIGMVVLYRFIPVFLTPLMVIRTIEQRSAGEKIVFRHRWVPGNQFPQHLKLALICSEDQRFLDHYGFDVESIKAARKYNHRQKGKKVRGASTISQQTAKNIFLWPQRSWLRKGLEVYFTVLIEVFWPKERIIEVYLNSIEMGKGVYGAEAAANYWFHKPANALTRSEAAAIAAIIPRPLKYRANPPTPYIQRRKNWILQQMSYYDMKKLKKIN